MVENKIIDKSMQPNTLMEFAREDRSAFVHSGKTEYISRAAEISESAYFKYGDNVSGKMVATNFAMRCHLDAEQFSKARDFGRIVLDDIGDEIPQVAMLDIRNVVELAELASKKQVNTRLQRAKLIARAADETRDPEDFLEAGDLYREAHSLADPVDVDARMSIAWLALYQYSMSGNVEKYYEFGNAILNEEGDNLNPFDREKLERNVSYLK